MVLMDVEEKFGTSLRSENLGRVAKVAAEPSCLGCIGLPPAQRDAGYRSGGSLSSTFEFAYQQGQVFDLGDAPEQALKSEPVAVADLKSACFMSGTGQPMKLRRLPAPGGATANLDRSAKSPAIDKASQPD
jgi:hypothetical protein